MSSAMNSIFGGGKAQTNFKDMEKFFQMQDEFSQKDKHGLFSSWVWEDGAQHQRANPLLQGGIDSLMGRVSSPYEGYSAPSGMSELLDSRMAHQFERMNMQPPGAGGEGPSIQPIQMPGDGPMPPQGGPMPPGAGGPMPPGMGGPPGQQMPGRGGMMGDILGSGMMNPQQQADLQAAATPTQAPPEWAQNQRFGGLVGGIEGAIDARRRNQGMPEDQRENILQAFMGGF